MVSEAGILSRNGEPPPPKPPPKNLIVDAEQAALLSSARIKMSTRDQEAMRKLRSTMMEYSDSTSSKSTSPLSPMFPSAMQNPPKELRSRRSTLSHQIMPGEDEEIGGEQVQFSDETPKMGTGAVTTVSSSYSCEINS